MKRTLISILSIFVLYLIVSLPTVAGKVMDSAAYTQLYKDYANYYKDGSNKDQFYEASEKLKDYYRKQNDIEQYYKMRLNEVMYETNHCKPYQAIKKANEMMEEMRAESARYYNLFYTALGVIFKSRGNYHMSDSLFTEALKNVSPNDTSGQLDIYKRMANLKMYYEPDEARKWNRRYAELIHGDPYETHVYLTIQAIIDLSSGNKEDFDNVYAQYHEFHKDHLNDISYGESILEIINEAMKGNYQEALRMTDRSGELSELEKKEVKIDISTLAGDYKRAFQISEEKAVVTDSLNSNMIFDNINEINAQMNLYQMKQATAKKMERMAIIIIALSFLVIIILAGWLFRRRKMRRHLLEKNEQLKTALEMAEESDRMKLEFVRQVSHEIRTPLNAINGFNQVLNESGISLSDKERHDLVERIEENTKAITDIIDELLNLSERGSAAYYTRNDDILCNKEFSDLLYGYRKNVNRFVELSYTTEVINRFTIRSNRTAVMKILDQLVENAIKFTAKGFIKLHCRQSDDGKFVEISVADSGRGISKEMRTRIFEQFFKIDHFQQGMGLGLTVSKKIAQKLGGDLTVDDNYTDGSRFVLTLPIPNK